MLGARRGTVPGPLIAARRGRFAAGPFRPAVDAKKYLFSHSKQTNEPSTHRAELHHLQDPQGQREINYEQNDQAQNERVEASLPPPEQSQMQARLVGRRCCVAIRGARGRNSHFRSSGGGGVVVVVTAAGDRLICIAIQ